MWPFGPLVFAEKRQEKKKRPRVRELLVENQEKFNDVIDESKKMLKTTTKASKCFIAFAKEKGVDISDSD